MMADCIVFDIRQLQKSILLYRPVDRIFVDLIDGMISSVPEEVSVKIFANHAQEIPSAVAHLSERIVCSLPFSREPVIVVELAGSGAGLRDLFSPQLRAITRCLPALT